MSTREVVIGIAFTVVIGIALPIIGCALGALLGRGWIVFPPQPCTVTEYRRCLDVLGTRSPQECLDAAQAVCAIAALEVEP